MFRYFAQLSTICLTGRRSIGRFNFAFDWSNFLFDRVQKQVEIGPKKGVLCTNTESVFQYKESMSGQFNSISHQSRNKRDKWFMQFLVRTTHMALAPFLLTSKVSFGQQLKMTIGAILFKCRDKTSQQLLSIVSVRSCIKTVGLVIPVSLVSLMSPVCPFSPV